MLFRSISTTDVINFLKNYKNQDTAGYDINGVIDYLLGNNKGTTEKATNTSGVATITHPVTDTTQDVDTSVKTLSRDTGTTFKMPTGYYDRSFIQDLAARQEMLHPGTYATGQFDPFYSGYLSDVGVYSQAPSAMNANGTFTNGPGYITPDRKSTRLNSSHSQQSRMPSSA